MENSGNAIIQRYHADTASGQCWIRQSYDGTNWNDWSRVDNFGCNTASALAELLGGQWEYVDPENVDFDKLKPMQRTEWMPDGHGQTHGPSGLAAGASFFTFGVLTVNKTKINHGFQFGGRDDKIAIRVCGYSVWGDWLYITP